jgi:hypothetical protein
MKIQEIERAVAELKPRELARFRAWFRAFENDAKSGRLDKPANKAFIEKRLRRLRGSLKGSGALKALIEERHKD